MKTEDEILKNEYHIKLSSPFEYIKNVETNFQDFEWNDELRDNSKTFILQGCYSSRLDLNPPKNFLLTEMNLKL